MRIEAYFQQLRDLVDACPVVQSSSITYDKRSTHEGYIRGEIYLVDTSVLHLREFVDVETTVERLLYVYQYMDARKQLRFRYDNTGHHKRLNLPTYPHHSIRGVRIRSSLHRPLMSRPFWSKSSNSSNCLPNRLHHSLTWWKMWTAMATWTGSCTSASERPGFCVGTPRAN